MLVTVYPPSEDGIVIAPVVASGTAREWDTPPPTDAFPLLTVYVHVMPLTVSVSASAVMEHAIAPTNRRTVFMCFVSFIVEPFIDYSYAYEPSSFVKARSI